MTPSGASGTLSGVSRCCCRSRMVSCATTPFDDECRQLADRHYSRRTVGARQFAYSGRKLVLRDAQGLVIFVWMYPDPGLRMDGQVGYNNALFRNESARRSSDIILEAERAAVASWGPNRAYTYIDPRRVQSAIPAIASSARAGDTSGMPSMASTCSPKNWVMRMSDALFDLPDKGELMPAICAVQRPTSARRFRGAPG